MILNQSRIRIGQDPKCEVSLPGGKYPSVSSEHVVLEAVDGAVKLVKGMRAGVETFLNGHPAGDGAAIRSGDVLRLGAGGPELRIRMLDQAARSTVYEPTRVLNQTAQSAREPARTVSEQSRTSYEPTRIMSEQSRAVREPARIMNEQSRTTHDPTRVISSPAAAAIPAASPTAAGAAARPSYATLPARGVPSSPYTPPASAALPRRTETVVSSTGTQTGYGQLRGQESSGQANAAQSAATRAAESENMQFLEGKLNTLRIILAVNLAVLLALFAYAYLQAQELAQTHKDLQALRVQAQSAVGALTPSLDARLNVFEKRMDVMDEKVATAQDRMVKGMDAQAKIAEDRLVQRMNAEIPAMLDKYVNQKMVELKH